MDISLEVNGYKFTFMEGEVKKVDTAINTNVEVEPVSGVPAQGSYVFDFNGVEKTITLSGILMETPTTRVQGFNITTIVQQIQWLESLCNGKQNPIKFSSNYGSLTPVSSVGATEPYLSAFTYTHCYVQSFKYTELEAITGEVEFSLVLVVGT